MSVRIRLTLLLVGTCVVWHNTAAAESLTEDDLVGVWVGYVDGTQPPGWFMDLRPDGAAYFLGRTIKEDAKWFDGSTQDVPTYELFQTTPLVREDGMIFRNVLSVFNHKKIPEAMQAGFDWSERSKLAAVMQTHSGAFALLPTPDMAPHNRDYWTFRDGSLGLKGHLFDVQMNGEILGFYPYAVCPYRQPTADTRFHPACGSQQISWKKAEKPTHTWKRVEGELLEEFMTYSVVPMLGLRTAGVSEAMRRQLRQHGNSEAYEDTLDWYPGLSKHPIAGPVILGEAVVFPGKRITGSVAKLEALLARDYGHWLLQPIESQGKTICEFYIDNSHDRKTVAVLKNYCGGKQNAASATALEKPLAQVPTKETDSVPASETRPTASAPGRDLPVNPMQAQAAAAVRSAGEQATPAPTPVELPAQPRRTVPAFPNWELVGLWDYDAADGLQVQHGIVLRDQVGSFGTAKWQRHLELKRHAHLAPRNRRLWPVKISRSQKRVCVDGPYPSYSGYIDLPGSEFDGIYAFASCKGD